MDLSRVLVMTRRGMSLIEVTLGMVLLGALATLLTRLMLGQGRLAIRFYTRAAALQAVTQATDWLSAELEEGGSSDLIAVAPDSIVYRASRGQGLACQVAAAEVRIRRDRLSSWRLPQPGRDSLALLLPADSTRPAQWIHLPVLGITPSQCGGMPALAIATRLPGPLPATLPPLVPVRIHEIVLAKVYRSLGEWWLGSRSVSGGEGLQPVTGPYLSNGVRFTFRSTAGRPTGRPDSASAVDVLVAPVVGDTAQWRVLLRNVR